MLFTGLVVGIISGNVVANAAGLDSLAVFIASCLLIIPSLAGARLLYVATHFDSRNVLAALTEVILGEETASG